MSSSLISSITVRDQLIGAGFYLTDSSTLNHVCWAVDGKKTVLFEEPNDPSSKTNMQPAVLSAIVVLSKQGFFLTRDANWRGPSEIIPHLHDVKASCLGVAARVNPFRDDFSALLVHARTLQASAASHEEALLVGFVHDNSIKFQHVLFQWAGVDTEEPDDASVPLDKWPVHNDIATLELERMKGSYCAVPIPAYNIANHLIHPATYRRELQGALVEIHFTLSHCAFKNKDTFTADVHTLQVLRAPHTVSSIVKHCLPSSFERPSPSATCSYVQGKAMSSSKKT
ncbi:hypothetical protein OG21DRAFT_1490782 [Imleria badia]|nr:hypothetical protein OG21DRAFT_1490782 [Imleria badia]